MANESLVTETWRKSINPDAYKLREERAKHFRGQGYTVTLYTRKIHGLDTIYEMVAERRQKNGQVQSGK